MSYKPKHITIKVPISREYRQKAQSFSQMQVSSEKSEQVYRNVLAVLATRNYLDMLDISSDLEQSQSWDLASHLTMDVADLYIPEVNGRIECRAAHPNDDSCFIPSDSWGDRVGYMVVQLNEDYTEGVMLGFMKDVVTETTPLQDLDSLDDFIDCLPDVSVEVPANEKVSESLPNKIGEWVEGVFKDIWQPTSSLPTGGIVFAGAELAQITRLNQIKPYVDQLYVGQKHQMPLLPENASLEARLVHLIHHVEEEETRFKAAELLWTLDPSNPAGGVRRVLDLGVYIEGYSLGLLAAILVRSDGRRSILFQIYPTRDTRFLPSGLQLIGLDENGTQFFEVTSRSQDDRISLKLVADEGDRFSIQVKLNDQRITEPFIV